MKYRIVVCDDNIDILNHITDLLKKNYPERLYISSYDNLEELHEMYETGHEKQPDIMIMDISFDDGETGKVDDRGIGEAVWLQNRFPLLKIIFLTGFPRMTPEMFRARPSALLLKPLSEDKLVSVLNKCMEEIEAEGDSKVVFESASGFTSFRVKDILYLESINHELHIHTADDDKKIWMKMSDALERFPKGSFIRIHQSYAVNISHIRSIQSGSVCLAGDRILPASKRRYSEAKKQYLEYLGRCE